MNIEKEMINRIKSIDWFCNCGNVPDIHLSYEIKYIDSWKEAKKYYSQVAWEDKTLQEHNNLTTFLFTKYRDEYSEWNNITSEAKKNIEDEIVMKIKKIKTENGLDDIFVDCVKWDILGAIMENKYQICNGIPIFFMKLLEIYEAGNFPCGWDNSSHNGRLIVF